MNKNGLRAAAAAAALVGGLVTTGTAAAAAEAAPAPQCAAPQAARISSQELGAHLARAIAIESVHPVSGDSSCPGCTAGAAFTDE